MTTLSRCPLLVALALCAVAACSSSYGTSVEQTSNADEAGTSDCLEPSQTIQYVSHRRGLVFFMNLQDRLSN